jgi:hypothetical protein
VPDRAAACSGPHPDVHPGAGQSVLGRGQQSALGVGDHYSLGLGNALTKLKPRASSADRP